MTAQIINSLGAVKTAGAQNVETILYDSILTGAAASFDVQNISSSYDHLRVLVTARGDTAASGTACLVRFNNDSGANYDFEKLSLSGATATAAESLAATSIEVANTVAANTATANYFGSVVFEIPSYAGATAQKHVQAQAFNRMSTSTGDLRTYLVGGGWRSTAVINRITVFPAAGNFVAGSRLTIIGIAAVVPPSLGSMIAVQYATTLPASPADGQEAILVDSTTNPTYQWRFRYNAGSSNTDKWEFVGGASLQAEVVTAETTTSSTYAALATAGPSVTLPRAGVYDVEVGCDYGSATDLDTAFMSYDIGGTGAVDADATSMINSSTVATRRGSFFRQRRKSGLTAVALTAKYKSVNSNTNTFANRLISVTPVRVS